MNNWHQMSIAEQLGNVGSEINRAVNWQKKNNSDQEIKAFYRALELLDLTINDSRWQNTGSLKEILRLREFLADFFLGDNVYGFTADYWQKYFLYLGISARS